MEILDGNKINIIETYGLPGSSVTLQDGCYYNVIQFTEETCFVCFHNKFGKLHRLDGPAVIHESGSMEFYIDGGKVIEWVYWDLPEVITYGAGGQKALAILDI